MIVAGGRGGGGGGPRIVDRAGRPLPGVNQGRVNLPDLSIQGAINMARRRTRPTKAVLKVAEQRLEWLKRRRDGIQRNINEAEEALRNGVDRKILEELLTIWRNHLELAKQDVLQAARELADILRRIPRRR
jgi:hypothetical protein